MNEGIGDEQHQTLREALGAYVLGHCDEDERAAIERHLDGCAGCRAELDLIAPAAGALAAADPDRLGAVPVPPDLGDRILDRVRAERRGADVPDVPARPVTSGRGLGPGPRPLRRRVLTAAAAVLVAAGVAAGGGAVGYAAAPKPPKEPLETVAVRSGPGLDVRAVVVPHTWGMEIRLTASGFEAGRSYRVRVLEQDGRRATAGAFVGTGAKQLRCNLTSAVLRDDADGFQVVDRQGNVVVSSRL